MAHLILASGIGSHVQLATSTLLLSRLCIAVLRQESKHLEGHLPADHLCGFASDKSLYDSFRSLSVWSGSGGQNRGTVGNLKKCRGKCAQCWTGFGRPGPIFLPWSLIYRSDSVLNTG